MCPPVAARWKSERALSATDKLSPTRLWILLGAAFLTFSIGAGFMHAYTVFLLTFVEVFGWSRAQVSIAYSVAQFVSGFSSPLVGWLVDRLGPRVVTDLDDTERVVKLDAAVTACAVQCVVEDCSIQEPDHRLVHQGRGREGMVGPLAPRVLRRR